MRTRRFAALAALLAAGAWATDRAAPPVPEFTAAQIVERNVAARGGLEAWRKVESMAWTGHLESLHAPVPVMPFLLLQQRPNKDRFEINALGQRTVRIFDGAHGWKVLPDQQGRAEVKPYSADEVNFARGAQGIDGPLLGYQAKGSTVALEGLDEIEGRRAYRLAVRLASGETDRLWIDAQNFLEIRRDRPAAGQRRAVSTFYRDYRPVEGLQVPFAIETGGGAQAKPDRMVIERVLLNPPVDDQAFARPRMHGRGAMALGDPPRRAARSAAELPSSAAAAATSPVAPMASPAPGSAAQAK